MKRFKNTTKGEKLNKIKDVFLQHNRSKMQQKKYLDKKTRMCIN